MESLEQRQLLAGPNLIGVQPNEGPLVVDGSVLSTAPRELVFRFDDSTEIDPNTLSGIRITRAGADGVFDSALATSDLGTNNQVLLEFRAVQAGTTGEGLQVRFTTSHRTSGGGAPLIAVNGNVIQIDLNSNPARPTQVLDLINGVAADPVASRLLQVYSVSGGTTSPLGTVVPRGTTVTLQGAGAAEAISDLGTNHAVRVRFLSTQSGASDPAPVLKIERTDAGGPANPLILVNGREITVRLNSHAGNETTVAQLIEAINQNPESSQLVRAVLEAGSAATLVGNRPAAVQTMALTGGNDIAVEPGYVGLGDTPNEIVFRFAESLPPDTYHIDIFGSGPAALLNVDGEAFNDGQNLGRQFSVQVGPQVAAVVPEPVRRQANGTLAPEVGVIDVYFSEMMDRSTATNVDYYQLVFTRDTANTTDDVVVKPTSVSYDPVTNVAKLTFAGPLARLTDASGTVLTGAARLRVGNAQTNPAAPVAIDVAVDPGSSRWTAQPLGDLSAIDSSGIRSVRLDSEIRNTSDFELQFPGGASYDGVRQIRPEDISRLWRASPLDMLVGGPDAYSGITTIQYEFPASFRGDDPNVGTPGTIDDLKTYFNLITEQQKQRVREVLSLFSEYLGVQFVEATNGPTSDAFFSIAVGDIYGANPLTTSGPGGYVSASRDRNGDGLADLVVLDFQDFQQSTDDQFGGPFFRGAMLAIGQVLGYGLADDLPQPITQSTLSVFNQFSDATFPSVADIVNGQFLYRPDSVDIDLYQFQLQAAAKVSIQTVAERLSNASQLDTQLRLFREDPATGELVEIAQNDDYFSNDSLIELELGPGRYFVGVSASGNDAYHPEIADSGLGGKTEGAYELRVTTVATNAPGLRGINGVAFDGDGDGAPGGIFNFWFVPADQSNTLYVDKAATSNGNGSLLQPFRNIDAAISEANRRNAAAAGAAVSTIRIVANGGSDGLIETASDNLSYQIGYSATGAPLADGTSLDVPKGVQLVIDAGVILKLRQARIGVGSTSPGVDRSDAAIQILGTPILVTANGQVARDASGDAISGSVIITSLNDPTVGNGNTSGNLPAVRSGDWGGIDLRGDIDYADSNRRNRESEGVFLNHIQHADLRYGGGQVSVDGQAVVVSPVEMALTRATVMNSVISHSADAAIAATPNTFLETRFDEGLYQSEGAFTPTVSRVGPDVHGNTIVENSINGLFIRVTTRTGGALQPLTGAARFDDTDIVHVLTENLVVQGNPGGAVAPSTAPSSLLVQALAVAGGGDVAPGAYLYRLSYFSATNESLASTSTVPVFATQTGQIQLSGLPAATAGSGFTGRRLYRAEIAEDGTVGEFRLVATLNANDSSYIDRAAAGSSGLPNQSLRLDARTNGRLAIDPGTIVKLQGSRIDVTFGADLIAEGDANSPVVFTSLNDDRYGAGGTFRTNAGGSGGIQAGDWGGIYVGHLSSASFDQAVLAGGGGATRVAGGFASYNVLEAHQATLRLANSRLEYNADGRDTVASDQLERAGHGENASGTIYVRGAQPVIVGNEFVGGAGPVLSFDVNSLVWNEVVDRGRASGPLAAYVANGNSGPLVAGNRLADNQLNGMEIRGGQVATEVVWDDVDMVHIVRDTIEVPNQYIYGGLRLESDARGSLVVKFANREAQAATATAPAIAAQTAGIVVGGSLATAADQLVDVADRIGGSLQVVGHPDFPVVLTSLQDDSIGAGFTVTGQPQNNTANAPGYGSTLPTGPEINNGTLIDNDVPRGIPGFFQTQIGDGNEVLFSGVTVNDGSNILIAQDYVFQYSTFLVVGGTAVPLAGTTVTQAATLVAADTVESRGTFAGPNGTVQWIATSYFENGEATLYSNLALTAANGETLGDIRVVSYLDEDVPPLSDNILYTVGTPGEADFRAFTVSADSRVGFSHGGFYVEDGTYLDGAQYVGWAADAFPVLAGNIAAGTQTFSIAGDINVQALPVQNDPRLGEFYGPHDVTTAFAWDTTPGATSAVVTSFLELVPEDPSRSNATPGAWTGIVIREAAHDRNVLITSEAESRTASRADSNAVPSQAQYLGELAPNESSGDENRRLGFIVDGSILTNGDVDVYSFVAEAGTQVWLDIDRTQMGLDAVLELVDANGQTMVLSDSSLYESRGDKSLLIPATSSLSRSAANPMNILPIPAGSPDWAYQDNYSLNPNDPGMRVTLPGTAGQRNLYHVRVRSSSGNAASLLDPSQLRAGNSQGNYQLQIRLREADETAGTQVRHAEVRYATNGIQVIGGPMNGPLVGEVTESSGDNNSMANAQPLSSLSSVDGSIQQAVGPLNSNLLATSVAGMISGATDVDWYRFDIQYPSLARDQVGMYFATIFDIDYADGFARGDLALYVFNEAGQLILVGKDSNIADDQATGIRGNDNSDLSRGSAGTKDPYIGVAELPEGRYFVAVSNQTQIPVQLDQYAQANASNPLLRMEPIDSVIRIAEDRIGDEQQTNFLRELPSAFDSPQVPTLFDPATAVVGYTLNDMVAYAITGDELVIFNPFTGQRYDRVGTTNILFNNLAFRANGELFGYSLLGSLQDDDADVSYAYFRFNTATGERTQVGLSGLETFHSVFDPEDGSVEVVDSDDGFLVQGMTYASNDLGFVIGSRPINRGNAYYQNVLYAMNPNTGAFTGLDSPNRGSVTIGDATIDQRAQGAGTQIRERGYIETGVGTNPDGSPRPATSQQLATKPATVVQSDGTTIAQVEDGSEFTIVSGSQSFRFEMDAGTLLQFATNPEFGQYAREQLGPGQPVRFSLTQDGVTTTYELDSGPVITLNANAIVDGATVRITDSRGASQLFEFDNNARVNTSGAIAVPMWLGQTSVELAEMLATAITQSTLRTVGHATPGQGRVDLSGDSTSTPPVVAGSGLGVVGAAGSNDPSVVTIPIREDFTSAELAEAVAAATGGAVAGDRVNYRNVTAANLTNLTALGLVQATGQPGVSSGATAIPFRVTDSAEAIAIRIAQVVNASPALQALGITASVSGHSVVFENAILNASDGSVSSAFTVAGVPPGGQITGITMVGSRLFAVSNAGGLYVVNNPQGLTGGQIGTYVATATELVGLNFTGISTGPTEIQSLRDANGNPLLFGTTADGRLYAFDIQGRLQPVFAGGATSVFTGPGIRGMEFSTLDMNLWHVTTRRASDAGHGTGVSYNDITGSPYSVPGGKSFYFGADRLDPRITDVPAQSPFTVARQDGQGVEGTYNFPGGAKGALQSSTFDLTGYAAADQPMLYFNYFLETDGVDGLVVSDNTGTYGRDQDAFRVYVVTADGAQHLVATNNMATDARDGINDEFDDNQLNVQPLFDNTGNWRQARVSLAAFAGQSDLQLRLEFATSGAFNDGDYGLQAVAGATLVDGAQFVINGQTFEIDLGPTITVPAGSQLASYYAQAATDPDHRVTVDVGGTTYVLNDGTRNVAADEVNVPLLQPGDGPLSTLSSETIATRLADAISLHAATAATVDYDFTAEGNDELVDAPRLPAVSSSVIYSGAGEFDSTSDVDLYRVDLPAGATLDLSLVADITPFTGNLRVFDADGATLASGTTTLQYTSDVARTVYIGFSSGNNVDYHPTVSNSGGSGVAGPYTASIGILLSGEVHQSGARLQLSGGVDASGGADGLVLVSGAAGATSADSVVVSVDSTMSATQVALAIQRAVADRFSNGVTAAFPVIDGRVSLTGTRVDEAGPFNLVGGGFADRYGHDGIQRARDNSHEGVYVDDFIIGFAERGEMVYAATSANDFITNPRQPNGTGASPTSGSYQLEIRDGSEYFSQHLVVNNQPAYGAFRAFDTNDRLANGTVITALPAAQIVDGATFQLTDGVSTLTFEMDLMNADGSSNGVQAGRIRVPLPTPASLPPGSDGSQQVAAAIMAAINSGEVRSLIDVVAIPTDGIDSQGNHRLNLFGDVIAQNHSGVLGEVLVGTGRGDQNRDRSSQGVIVIENSRFLHNANAGIEITRDATAQIATVDGVISSPTIVPQPRNLVELNTDQLIPGVVVQSNVMAYNSAAGLSIIGSPTGPVGFDRIVNNTVVGGAILSSAVPTAASYQGTYFPGGAISFADEVVNFTPGANVGSQFNNPGRAIGAPDSIQPGEEPSDGLSTVSLGNGGSITLAFTDNYLTGSNDARPDLIVYETGATESVRVEISRDGTTFHSVGTIGGASRTIDLDQFGFGAQDRFSYVRLTDLRQGSQTSGPAGADIDAVGALSTVAADVYVAAGQGIVVSQNASPTLLNNVIANTQTGLTIDNSSGTTVVGATAYYRNQTNAVSPQAGLPGQFSEVIPASVELFVDPANNSFVPRAGTSIIDSSIDSLLDRDSLRVVKSAIGLQPSPIIAPQLDVNGQLRVDDPAVTPVGMGESVFKDRGAEERADRSGPRVVLVSPRAADIGIDAGLVETRGGVYDSFDIQLIDGILPVDPAPGVGVDDSSVTSSSLVVTKDGELLAEGRDYRFGYDASNNLIRLTPIAGMWEDGSVYVVRLLDASDWVLRFNPGWQIDDGAITTLLTADGQPAVLEAELGIVATMNLGSVFGQFDGHGLQIFDGSQTLRFELDNDGFTSGDTVVEVEASATADELLTALAAAINDSALNVTAVAARGKLQILSDSALTEVSSLNQWDTLFSFAGQIGTNVGFGIQVPSVGGTLDSSVQDGQTFRLMRGANLVRTFELDFGNGTTTDGAIRVNVGPNPTIDDIAQELVRVIRNDGLGLTPQFIGDGRLTLGGDANYALDLTDTGLIQLGAPGQTTSLPVAIPIDATAAEVQSLYAAALDAANLDGVSYQVAGDRLLLNGLSAIGGNGAVNQPQIRDAVGNLLQNNRDNGRTELTIFVGGGFDYGSAPEPYATLLEDDGPRHRVDQTLSLGPTVRPSADAEIGNSDNDGVFQIGTAAPGFNAQFTIEINADSQRAFYVDAWIDWNQDGQFSSDEVTRYRSVHAPAVPGANLAVLGVGINSVSIPVPGGALPGTTWARFRLSEQVGLGPVGIADSGEVEDLPILVQANPFQNPLSTYDVNRSGSVTPLDALNILNLLTEYRNSGGSGAIPLDPPPASLPSLVNQTYLPDVNGSGTVTVLDALMVLNELRRLRMVGEGELAGPADVADVADTGGYLPVAEGVLASPLTLATTQLEAPEYGSEPVTTISDDAVAVQSADSSIFDSPAVGQLDDLLDMLAGDDRPSQGGQSSSVDSVFTGLGLGQ